MAKNNSNLKYEIIWNNNKELLLDKYYQKRLEKFSIRFPSDINLFKSYTHPNFLSFKKLKGTSPYYLRFTSFDSHNINFYVGYLKNAGMESNDKRLQISPNIPNFDPQMPYYALGFLPTGDDEIIILVEMREYVKKKIKSKTNNNSSLWINFDNISEAYFQRKLIIQQDHDKKRYIFRRSQTELVNKVFSSIFGVEKFDEELVEPVKINELETSTYKRLLRNNSLRDEALKRANYTCELCGKNQTFQDKDKQWYFEAHHIIPFNLDTQKKFLVNLDHLSNLVCLCPECHRKAHFSEIKEQLNILEHFLNNRPLIKKYYLIKDSHQLIKFYSKEGE